MIEEYFNWNSFWGHFSFILIGTSMLARDILWLRVISTVASLASIIFNYLAFDNPIWLVINWNLVFISINVLQIILLLKEKASVSFSDEEEEMYSTMFQSFSKVEFMKMLRAGKWVRKEKDFVFTKQGDDVENIFLIYNGIASVYVDESITAELKDGAIIGEMSFMTGNAASATVVSKTPVRFLYWKQESLKLLLLRNPSMKSAIQTVFSLDLTKKLANS